METPKRRASCATVSTTWCRAVCLGSTRLIETWTTSARAVGTPMALTAGNPPLDARMTWAIRLAISRSPVFRLMLKAMRTRRAPIAVAPPEGCGSDGPKSGFHAGSRILPGRPSNSPRLTCSSRRRSGTRAASPYRYIGRPKRLATSWPNSVASVTQMAMAVVPTGTRGITSTAPIRGCTPV